MEIQASLHDVWDTGAGAGNFVLNGAALSANQDIAALQARWRSARERIVAGLRGTSSD